jgi:hypothetical protein
MAKAKTKMKERQREAVIAALANELRECGSWCGETHMQKAIYVLQELLEVPLGFRSVLYKYGPFGFELRDEMAIMRADGFFESEQVLGYGPRIKVTDAGARQLLKRWPKTVRRYQPRLHFVAERFGNKGVGELERLATALWVSRDRPEATLEEKARRLHEIKPHVDLELAQEALEDVAEWESDASLLLTPAPKRSRRAQKSSA